MNSVKGGPWAAGSNSSRDQTPFEIDSCGIPVARETGNGIGFRTVSVRDFASEELNLTIA